MQKLIEMTRRFNYLAGNSHEESLNDSFWENTYNQSLRIIEEAKETVEAAMDKNPKELLDGILDLVVVVSHLYDQLEASGFDLDGAGEAIGQNNLDKITTDKAIADETVLKYAIDGVACKVLTFSDSCEDGNKDHYSVRRCEDNKIMKLVTHKKVDLEDYLPL